MGAMKVCNCGTRFKGVEGFMLGFPGGLAGKESACNVGDLDLIPGLGRFPWRRMAWQPTLAFLPENSHRQRSLGGYSP